MIPGCYNNRPDAPTSQDRLDQLYKVKGITKTQLLQFTKLLREFPDNFYIKAQEGHDLDYTGTNFYIQPKMIPKIILEIGVKFIKETKL